MPSASSRLHEVALSTLSKALPHVDFRSIGVRTLSATLRSGIQLVQCRGADIPALVARRLVDVGLTGYDVIVESAIDNGKRLDVRSLAPLRSSSVCLVSAPGRGVLKRLYSEYPHLTRSWARSTLRYSEVEIVHVHGSAEGLVAVDGESGGVVLVTTGETVRANGLVVELPIVATDLCIVQRGEEVSTIGGLAVDLLPRLAMPQFVGSEDRA